MKQADSACRISRGILPILPIDGSAIVTPGVTPAPCRLPGGELDSSAGIDVPASDTVQPHPSLRSDIDSSDIDSL